MKLEIFLTMILTALVAANRSTRAKRQAYDLPDGAELLVGPIDYSFQCTQDGYFADIFNGCKIFHVCHTANHASGKSTVQHYSFLCGNLTVFNQLTFTCTYPEQAIPCGNSAEFFYLNARIGQDKEFFLTDADLQKAAPLLENSRATYGGDRYPDRGYQQPIPISETAYAGRPGPGL